MSAPEVCSSDTRQADHVLDAVGLFCPEPVMMLHNTMRIMQSGQVVKIVATDPSTQRDIPKFCQFLGHKLLESSSIKEEGYKLRFVYWIEKAASL